MLLKIPTILTTLILPLAILSARLTITIPATNALPNPAILPSSTHAVLSLHGEPLRAPLTRANTFRFASVPPGSHLLTIHSHEVFFENLRVDIAANETGEWVTAWTTWRGNEWDNKGELRGEGDGRDGRLEVRTLGGKAYYQERTTCEFLHGSKEERSIHG
jgi:ER membrane protein complex subunit 7